MPDFDLDAAFAEPPVAAGIYFVGRNGGLEFSELKPPGFTRKMHECRAAWSVDLVGRIYVLKNRHGKVGDATAEDLRQLKEAACA